MRVLLIHPHDIFSRSEPWTSRIVNIGKELKKKGHEVRLIYFPLSGEEMEWYEIPFPAIPLSRKRGWWILALNTLRLLRWVGWAEVVHFQKCFHHSALPAVISAWLLGKPLHYDWDDWEYQIYHYRKPPSRLVGKYLWIVERLLPILVETVSVSSSALRQLAMDWGVKEDRIYSAPVGADIETFKPDDSGRWVRERYGISKELVLYMGQLHGGQYAELFIESAALLKSRYPEVNFMIVGGGYRLRELREYSEKLKAHVIFTGSVPHEEIPRYINACDIAVACFEENPITRCKSPLKIAEYMACGKPVVASDVGEVRGMLGEAGLLVPPGDSQALAEGIEKLLLNPSLRRELGRKGRERAEKIYNWANITENLLRAYRKALYGKE